MFSKEKHAEIIQALQAKIAKNAQCPMCKKSEFTLANSYIKHQLQPNLKDFAIGGLSIPAIAIVCTNCGFISQHAIGALGLLSTENDND